MSLDYRNKGTIAATVIISRAPDLSGNFICDGTEDDFEIQRALNYVNTLGGGTVVLLIGTYTLDNQITIGARCTLRGTWASIIIPSNTFTDGQIILINGDYGTLENVVVDGNKANVNPNGVSGNNADYIAVKFCEIRNCDNYSLNYYKCDHGLMIYNHIHASDAYGIATSGTSGEPSIHCLIHGNHLEGCDSAAIKIRNTDQSIISKNNIQITLGDGIQFAHGDGPTLFCSAIENIIRDTLGTQTTAAINISTDATATSEGHLIQGNQATNCYYGILVGYVNTLVTGNIVNNSRYVGIYVSSDGSNAFVEGNRLQDDGIHTFADYVTLQNNYIVGGTASFASGIFVRNAPDRTYIDGNTIRDVVGIGIQNGDADETPTNTIITNTNKITGCTTTLTDFGTGTVLTTKTFEFIAGGDVDGTAAWSKYVSATASAKGWQVNGAADWAQALGQLPLELQQVVRIKIWAVALGAPVGSPGEMRVTINMNAGVANASYATEPFLNR